MGVIKKIFKVIIYAFLTLIMVICLIASITPKIYKTNYPVILGYTYFEVSTGSMMPELEIGDLIIVKITDDVKADDVITYKSENNFITHRIISIDNEMIITKGDANNTPDQEISKNSVVGKVIKTISGFGKVYYVATNIYFLIAVFGVIITFIIVASIKKDKKLKEE